MHQESPPASDLFYQGKMLFPHQARKLRQEGLDLSRLDPDPTSDLWHPSGELEHPDLPLKLDQEFHFENEEQETPSDYYRFVAKGAQEQARYYILIGRRAHNVLLRRGLLTKLGYSIPPMQRVVEMKLHFKTPLDLELFLLELRNKTSAHPQRWIRLGLREEDYSERQKVLLWAFYLNQEEVLKEASPEEQQWLQENPKPQALRLSDAVISSVVSPRYNLAWGVLNSSIIDGRRLLNALLIPYALTEVAESINRFHWFAGLEQDGHLVFSYPFAEEFQGNLDDARWIARRIAKLSRLDWEEVVAQADLPHGVSLLLIEKLISRRNHLMQLLRLSDEEMEVNPHISGPHLENGKLTKTDWEGYGTNFSFGDTESPFSGSEVFAFMRSKLYSNLLSNLIFQFNDQIMPHIDLLSKIEERQDELFFELLKKRLTTGEASKVPLGVWTTPLYGVNLIASRDVVAGSYLGTDNFVQLADSIGVSANLGLFAQVEGISAPWGVWGQANISLNRTYTHIRPITSISESLNESYRNMLIPLMQKEYADLFQGLFARGLREQANSPEARQKLHQVMELFKKELKVGESFIISDSIGPSLETNVSYGIEKHIAALARMRAQHIIVSRLHILRSDADTLQIYKSLGNASSLRLSVGLNAIAPVISLEAEMRWAQACTKFFTLDLSTTGLLPSERKVPGRPSPSMSEAEVRDLWARALAIRSLFLDNTTELAEAVQTPYIIKHDLSQTRGGIRLLAWSWEKLDTLDRIHLRHPGGSSKRYFRRFYGERSGTNYEQLAIDAANGSINAFSDEKIILNNQGNGRPGDSFMGSSYIRAITLDAEVIQRSGREEYLHSAFVDISHTWRGWSLDREGAEEILKLINKKNARFLYPQHFLGNTERILLYQITFHTSIYSRGIRYFLRLPYETYMPLLNKYRISYRQKRLFHQALIEFNRARPRGDLPESTYQLSRMVAMLDALLPTKELVRLFGGARNVYITSRLQGFREGEEHEKLEAQYISSSLGEIGDPMVTGPVNYVRNLIGAGESEFFAFWLVDRL